MTRAAVDLSEQQRNAIQEVYRMQCQLALVAERWPHLDIICTHAANVLSEVIKAIQEKAA